MTTLKKPIAFLFDWDDTLIDCWPLSSRTLDETFLYMGKEPWTPQEALRRAGPTARDIFPGLFGDRWREAEEFFYNRYMQLSQDGPVAKENAERMLKFLQQSGFRLGVVSNKRASLLAAEAQKLGWEKYFDAIIGAGVAEADKPSPAPAFFAMAEMNLPPGPNIWFIGDSFTDMACAHASGCTPVLIESKPPPEESLAATPPALRVLDCRSLMEFVGDNFTSPL